jgi:hypothetical protein
MDGKDLTDVKNDTKSGILLFLVSVQSLTSVFRFFWRAGSEVNADQFTKVPGTFFG